jgi:surfactin synthase thioesterase subunit
VTGRRAPWLLREPRPDSEARLFCLPYSGSGASLLRRWPLEVGPAEVCPVQLAGRESRIREQPYRDVRRFADEAVDGLADWFDRPYALFGHCTGALLAHALAVRVQERGLRPPDRLFVSSAVVPHRPPERRYRLPEPGALGVYHPSMTDEQFGEQIRRVAGVLGAGEVLPELMPFAVRALRADVEMCFAYQLPRPAPVSCPISAISWTDDPDVQPASMLEWEAYGQVRQHLVDGGKLTFAAAPPALLDILAGDLLDGVPSADRREGTVDA